MLYDTYPCTVSSITINQEAESYEVPGYDGARVSKYVSPGQLVRCQYEDVQCFTDLLERGCRLSGNGRCVGWRSSKSEYSWLNYKQFKDKAINFGSGLLNIGIKLSQTCRIGIYAQNSIEWLATQYGCFYYSSPIVPLYDTIGPDARTFMINNAEIGVVICDNEVKVKSLLDKSELTPVLKTIIHVKEISEETRSYGNNKGIELRQFSDIEELGKNSLLPVNAAKPSDEAIICYTSGTTGNPKGAILTHRNIIAGISGLIQYMGDLAPNTNDTAISYLPLAHVYEQLMEVLMFLQGGNVGYFSGDVSLLTDDMKVLQPTIFPTVPRVLNKMYDKIMSQIKKQQSAQKQNGHSNGKVDKGSEMSEPEKSDHSLLYKSISNSLGGKVKLVISGAAPISENILNFFQKALDTKILEVYGQTETSGPTCSNIVSPESIGCVGPPLLCNMIRLEDVPELEYFKKNQIGEVCVKGPNVFKGYLKDQIKTAEAIDENGWLHTGDIGRWLPNGVLKIVDRKHHIFKLAQGEYVMPEKIEGVYLTSSYVEQIFVHGDSLQSFLVAIVIPSQIEVNEWCKENSISGTWNEICSNPVVKQHILEDIIRVGKSAGLLSFQQIKAIHLHPDLLTVEGGHLTPTQKTKRTIVRKFFTKEIQALYNVIS